MGFPLGEKKSFISCEENEVLHFHYTKHSRNHSGQLAASETELKTYWLSLENRTRERFKGCVGKMSC